MMSKDGIPTIIDFGFAHTFHPFQKLKTPCGSQMYAAPEILAHSEYDGSAADVWSLGVITYGKPTSVQNFP